jgi:hypothetical protein
MKYQQPYGITDPNASYINGDPSQARQGSIPPAAAFENPMREIVAVITNSGITPADTDLQQMAKGIRSQFMNYAQDTGSVNNLSVAYTPPITSYTLGLLLRVKVANTNTANCTINAGAGTAQIKKPNGAQLAAGDINAGGLIDLAYDGSAFQMVNFGGTGGGTGGSTFLVNIPYAVDTSATPNLVVANFSPAVTSLSPGTILMVKIANTNTGPSTINVQGMGPKQIYAMGGGDLLPSDMVAGDVILFMYDGTRFYISPNSLMSQSITLNVPSTQFPTMANVFNQLGRKRIPPNVTLTIQMASGQYAPFTTYHVDADRIIVQGTMLAAAPGPADFAKTGNTAAARAADSASNIAMLRTRFGTEIQFTNAQLNALIHTGPGRITYRQLLITGQNVYAGNPAYANISAVAPQRGCAIYMDTCAVWGSGSFGIVAIESTFDANNVFVSGCWTHGVYMHTGGRMAWAGGGSFGNTWSGIAVATNGNFFSQPNASNQGLQSQMNGNYGFYADAGASINAYTVTITGNATLDVFAGDNSVVSGALSSTWATASPPSNGGAGNNGGLVYLS